MTIQDLVNAMQRIAPLEYAESWDKVGLLAGDSSRKLSGPVLLTIDLTEPVLAEAIEKRASAIIAYHPPIWEPLTKITDATPRQRIILRALESGIAIYSPHTSLDAIPGGVTEWLCEGLSGSEELANASAAIAPEAGGATPSHAGSALGAPSPRRIAGDCRALTPHSHTPSSQRMKIVTFVPAAAVESVRQALASAGAGVIGGYQVCSFTVAGVGTFLGGPGTAPKVGKPGQIEATQEHRLEMVCSRAALALALDTLKSFHPYEEPAIDVYELAAKPKRTVGAGRRLVLDKPVTVSELAARLKKWIKRDRVRYALPDGMDPQQPISFVGVCPGSGASLSKLAKSEGCEVFVTGEMGHHDVMGALNAGMSVILGNHTSTERGYLPRLASMISLTLPEVQLLMSQRDRDPLTTI